MWTLLDLSGRVRTRTYSTFALALIAQRLALAAVPQADLIVLRPGEQVDITNARTLTKG